MKKTIKFLALLILLVGCKTGNINKGMNPLLSKLNTPFNVPPFNEIKEENYLPAFRVAIQQLHDDIDAIVNNIEEPSFENTIVAVDNSGELLAEVNSIFFSLFSSNTSDKMIEIAKEITPVLSQESDDILLNANLFLRIKKVYVNSDKLNLNPEKKKLLLDTYKDFERGGANLNGRDKIELKDINEKLSLLTMEFGNNQLHEINSFKLLIDNTCDLEGLPKSVIETAAQKANESGDSGKWLFTIQKPSLFPFLQYSTKRNLREKIFTAYTKIGDNNNEYDNKHILNEIVNFRLRKANLLGFKTYAAYVLDNNMAKTPEKVYNLLYQVYNAALPNAKEEVRNLQSCIDKEKGGFKLAPWDWWYYAEKLKKDKYSFNEDELKPYFKLENVVQGVFDVANKLYGITFTERNDIPTYYSDVKTYELTDSDGSHIGVLYMDFFVRDSKHSGAWMGSFRKQSHRNGKEVSPVVTTVFNFTKPTKDAPTLLSPEEVRTVFHEFGHALHGLLSQCTYYKLSGTSVERDFVELPSQIMENWAMSPEVLKMYAKNYTTGKIIPDKLIEKISNSSKFNQGFETVELLSAAILDMQWHSISKQQEFDINAFEKSVMDSINMISEIIVRYKSTYFSHIFSGGYAAGYYSYIWAEVLDLDAFEKFKETGLFNKQTANSFRKNILEKGGSEDPMALYKRFRGSEPSIEPLLISRGLK